MFGVAEPRRARFSVQMSTYQGDHPEHLRSALDSIFSQTLLPEEIVLVVDGPVTTEHDRVIDAAIRNADGIEFRVVRLATNHGLGGSSDVGLRACRCEWIARMDADDLAVPERFARQWAWIEEHPRLDLLASWHAEFDEDPETITRIKATPETHDEIVRSLRWRNVISHPTIFYRREVALAAGGYPQLRALEEYDLYLRMVAVGARFHALQEPLVKVRATLRQASRRGGLRYAGIEWTFRYRALRRGDISFPEFVAQVAAFTTFRLIPSRLRAWLYRFVRVSADQG